MRRSHLHLTSALAAVLGLAGVAHAEDQAAPAPPQDSAVLGEVIVTATKTSQSIQKVAAAVTAVSGEALAERNVVNLAGVQNLVPSVRFQYENDIAQTYVRGIGSGFDGPWVPESVATNFNGMNLPRHLTGTAIFDVSSIEVLPGPQGTLYGRAAIGGVVNINANRPNWSTTFDAVTNAGNYGSVGGTYVGNIPLSDTFAVRAAANFDKNDGYNDDGSYSTDSLAFRGSALWKPAEDISLYAWGNYYKNDPRVGGTVYLPEQQDSPHTFPHYDASSANFYPPNGASNWGHTGRYRARSFGGELNARLGAVNLTYIPTYAHYNGSDTRPVGGFIQSIHPIRLSQYTHELRINNAEPSRLEYVVGVYYSRNKTLEDYVFGPNFGGGYLPVTLKSLAAYGQLTFKVNDTFRLTGGARVSEDKNITDGAYAIFPIFNPVTFQFDQGRVPFNFDRKWKHTDWKIGFEADIGEASMLYANVQTGYNPGSFDSNAIPLTASRDIRPQEVTALTAGLKNRFFNRKFLLNVESYYYDYKDLILQQFNAATGNIIIYNAPKSKIWGGSLETSYILTEHDRITANVGYNHATIKEFTLGGVDYAGYTLPNAPRWTASLGYQHVWDLPADASLTFRADSYLNSGFYGLYNHIAGSHQDGYMKSDLALTYAPASGRWDLGVWVKNLENETVIAAMGQTAQPYPRTAAAYIEPPRTYGVRLHFKLGQ